MDHQKVIDLLRKDYEETKNGLSGLAADALEISRTENAMLVETIAAAHTAMTYAPIWHGQHRVISEILNEAQKILKEKK